MLDYPHNISDGVNHVAYIRLKVKLYNARHRKQCYM